MRTDLGTESGVQRAAAADSDVLDDHGPAASTVAAGAMAWAFTQHEPLDTGTFITQASRRSVQLDTPMLRELYRRRLLIPFVSITYPALSDWRRRGKDIKRVWESGRWDGQQPAPTGRWDYEVSKTELAKALWPILEAKIERCRTDPAAPIPEIAEVIRPPTLSTRWNARSAAALSFT